ncbi:MAG TPA: hypothetical protein VFD50_04380 [Thermoleophilia bacterium]|nr:hypothetical protein [Thermoleophilia bacterium]
MTQAAWVILVFRAWGFLVITHILVTHLAGRSPAVADTAGR